MATYSIIIPVYNRPDEMRELLDSLLSQQCTAPVEVVVIEDGSTLSSSQVVEQFAGKLNIKYLQKENGGPSAARNFGAQHATGDWLLILDSDCVMPAGWLAAIDCAQQQGGFDAFGGPDRAHSSFTTVQKAINYSMTSFFTTGGIRGQKKSLEKYHPRSFNMGIRREAFLAMNGFALVQLGEDIDLSMRLMEGGYKCILLPDAWLYHKRRVDMRKFFRQVWVFGAARFILSLNHPGTLRLVHLLPAAFTVFVGLTFLAALAALFMSPVCALYSLVPLALWVVTICVDSAVRNRSAVVGFVSICSSFVQLTGYGLGFFWSLCGGWRKSDRRFYGKDFQDKDFIKPL